MADAFLCAVLLGIAFGVLYDVFRFFRLILNDKFFLDFLFWIICAIAAFCYLLIYNNGEIRIIYFILIFTGMLFYLFTLGSVTKRIEIRISKKMKIRLKKVKKLFKSFKKVLHSKYNIYYNKLAKRMKPSRVKNKGENNDEKDEEEQFF